METASISIPNERIAAFCRRYQVTRLALFGSVVHGDLGPDSDVDVLVTFAPEAEIGFMALSRMRRALSEIFQRPVDLVPAVGLKPLIKDDVLASSQVIYAA